MPRLPTIRVIGSHDMSTMFPASGWTFSRTAISVLLSLPPSVGSGSDLVARVVAGGERVTPVAPLGLLAHRLVGDAPQPADHRAVALRQGRGQGAAGRLVHEGHELVGEAGHRAPDACLLYT